MVRGGQFIIFLVFFCIVVQGTSGTPYEGGSFLLDITIPDRLQSTTIFICVCEYRVIFLFVRYPFEPPLIKFITKVYHPNIDNTSGLICMDLLKMPPKGSWRPAINLSSLLTSVQLLLTEPNPNDPLDANIVSSSKNSCILCNFCKHFTHCAFIDASRLKSLFATKVALKRLPDYGPNNMQWCVV